jgi:YidC/Oxa1 family membrane protein insertase
MDNRDNLRNIAIAGAVFFVILWVWPMLLPPPPRPASTPLAQDVADTTAPPGSSVGVSPGPRRAEAETIGPPAETGSPPPAAEPHRGFSVLEADGEQTLEMGSAPANGMDGESSSSPYRMRLGLSNVGASVESATMTDHAEELGSDARYRLLSLVERDDGSRYRSLAIDKIIVDDEELRLDDKRWHTAGVKTYQTGGERGERVEFRIEIQHDGQPALELTRTFKLPRQEKIFGRHDLSSTLTVENLSKQSHRVIVAYHGGLGVRRMPAARMDDRFADCGIFDGARVVGSRKNQSAVSKNAGQIVDLYKPSRAEPNLRLAWAATANTYFTATIAPLNRDGTDNATYLAAVSTVDLDGSPFTDDDVTVRFVTRAEQVAPGALLRYPADIYLGEKDGDAFRSVEVYGRRNYYFQISQGFGWCTFSFLVELMIWLLNGLFWIARDYGVAIIILVLIVRTLLHPITKKGQVNMVRMQQRMGEFAPKIEELKKKFGNDKARLQQETMKLYRDHGINPATQMLTCLPMFLQMPIWVALFLSLSNNIQLRHQGCFLLWWVDDLTAPDALIPFSSPIIVPWLGWAIPAFNLLPILVAVFMYIQQKLQPKPKPNPNMSDQQRQQQEMMQKMMPMMSIMMLFIFYQMPSGLNLYIMFSSLFGAIEQHRIRKHIKDREAAGTLHKPARTDAASTPTHARPGKRSWFQKLQKMAEDAQSTQARRPAKSKSRR